MLSSIKRMIGAITVHEGPRLITIQGLPANFLLHDFYRIWGTSKIGTNMFNHVGRSDLSFNKFFAQDFAYMIKTVLAQPKARYNHRALRRVLDLLYEFTWLRQTLEKHPSILNYGRLKELTVSPLDHQWDFLKQYDENVPKLNLNGYLLAAEPGSGKTLTNVMLSLCLNADVTIFVVPKNSIDEVWVKTLETRFKKTPSYWSSGSGEKIAPGRKYYIVHYEQLEVALEFFRVHAKKHEKFFIALDESHNFNEIGSMRTQLFIELCHLVACKNVVWASGTAVKAIGNEMIPFLMTADPLFVEDARERFMAIFGKSASRAVDVLRNRLGMMTFKVGEEAVGVESESFPVGVKIPNGNDYTLESVRADMREFILERMAFYESHLGEYIKTYDTCIALHKESLRGKDQHDFALYKQYVGMIRTGYDPATMKQIVIFCNKYEKEQIIPSLPQRFKDPFRDARSVVKYYPLKVQGEALGRILGKKRAQAHVDMVRHSPLIEHIEHAKTKTVLFTSFVEVVHECDAYLRENGFNPVLIYGETNKDLSAIIETFRSGIDVNPAIATYKSLSTAVPMVMASTAVLLNPPFRDYERKQAVARLVRRDQPEFVTIWDYTLDTGKEPNISTRSADIMSWSKAQVEAIMGTKLIDDAETVLESYQQVTGYELSLEDYASERPAWLDW